MPPNLSRIVSAIKLKTPPAPPEPSAADLLRGYRADQRSPEDEAAAAAGARALLHAVRPPAPIERGTLLAHAIQTRREQGI